MTVLAKQQSPLAMEVSLPMTPHVGPAGLTFPHRPRNPSLSRPAAGEQLDGPADVHGPPAPQARLWKELESSQSPQNQGQENVQAHMCLLSVQQFSWTDCPYSWVSPRQRAKGCAWDCLWHIGFIKIKNYFCLGSSL